MAVNEWLGENQDSFASSIEVVRKALKRLWFPPDIVEKRLKELMSEAAIYNNRGNSERQRELPPSIVKYCEWFVRDMEWISKKQKMVELFKQLYRDGKLHIDENILWKIVKLDWLWYEILILDLEKYIKNSNDDKVLIKNANYSSSFFGKLTDNCETYGDELQHISWKIDGYYSWFYLPEEKDVKDILKNLTTQYGDVIQNTKERKSEFHDEDIAFLMLLAQIYWEFRLENWKVLKCYNKFRWFKWAKQGWTAQVLLIRKVK